MMKKYLLLTFPDAPIKMDGICPRCGHYTDTVFKPYLRKINRVYQLRTYKNNA